MSELLAATGLLVILGLAGVAFSFARADGDR